MNLISKNLLTLLSSAAETMRMDIYKTLQDYHETIARETQIAAKYKNEDEYLSGQKSKQVLIARDAINRAVRLFKGKASEVADKMEGELKKHLHEPINTEFREKLSMINDFNVQPERMDIEVLLSLANGNQTALAALAATLKKVHSQYSLNYHTTADFQKDIDLVRELSRNVFYIPSEYRTEGAEIFSGEPYTFVYPNGGSIGMQFDAINIMTASMDFEEKINVISGLGDIWAADCSYGTAEQFAEAETAAQNEMNALLQAEGLETEPIANPESGVSLDNSSAEGIRIAKELGVRTAAGAQTLQKVMGVYGK